MIKLRNLTGIEELMNNIDMIHANESVINNDTNRKISKAHIALRLPHLFDQNDNGKNIIHKCA